MAAQLQTQQMDFGAIRQRGIQAIMANPGMTQSRLNSEVKRLDEIIEAKQREQLVRQGAMDLSDIAESDPASALRLVNEGFRPAGAGLTAAEQKAKKSKTNTETILRLLEDQYFGIGDESELSSLTPDLPNPLEFLNRFLGVGKRIGAAIGANPRLSNFLKTKQSVRPTLARAAGDVGNLSLPEQEAAVGQLPGGTSTFEEALLGFSSARKKFGLSPRDVRTEVRGGASSGAGLSQEDEALIQRFKQ